MMNNISTLVGNVDDFMTALISYMSKQEELGIISSGSRLCMSHKESLRYLLGKLTGSLDSYKIHTDVLLYLMRKSLDEKEEINSLKAFLFNREKKCYSGFVCAHPRAEYNAYLLQ